MNSYIGGLPLTSKKKILLYLLVIVLSQENPKEIHRCTHTHSKSHIQNKTKYKYGQQKKEAEQD